MGNSQSSKNRKKQKSSGRVVQVAKPCSASQVKGNSQTVIDIALCALCEYCHTKSETCSQAQESKRTRPDASTHSQKGETVQKASSSSKTTQSINQRNDLGVYERSQAKTQATQASQNSQIRQGVVQKSERIHPDTASRKDETILVTSLISQTTLSLRRSDDKALCKRNSAVALENQQKDDTQNVQTERRNFVEQNVCAPEMPASKRRPSRDDPWNSQTGQSRDFELCVFCERSHNVQQCPQINPQIIETEHRAAQDLRKSHLTKSQTNIQDIQRISTGYDSCSLSHTGQSHDVQLCKQSGPKSRETQCSLTRDIWRHSQTGESQVEQFEKCRPTCDDSWHSETGRSRAKTPETRTDREGIFDDRFTQTVREYSQILSDHNLAGIGQNELGHPGTNAEYLEKMALKKPDNLKKYKCFKKYPQSSSCISIPNPTDSERYSDVKKNTAWCYKCQTAYRISHNNEDMLCQHLSDNCTFKEVQCPFGCSWKGSLKKLLNHLDNLHDQDTANVGSEMQLQDIDNNSHKIYLVLIGGSHFLFHVKVSRDRKVYMTVQLVGSKKKATRWFFEIQVYNRSNFRRKYTFTDTCKSTYESVDGIFGAGNCSVLSKTYASSFTQNGGLSYKFFIRRSDYREARSKH